MGKIPFELGKKRPHPQDPYEGSVGGSMTFKLTTYQQIFGRGRGVKNLAGGGVYWAQTFSTQSLAGLSQYRIYVPKLCALILMICHLYSFVYLGWVLL